MKKYLALLAFIPHVCLGCIEGLELKLTKGIVQNLMDAVHREALLSSVNDYRSIYSYRLWGLNELGFVSIGFTPHKIIGDEEFYYYVRCEATNNVFDCSSIEERRSITASIDGNVVDLLGSIVAEDAVEVIEFLKTKALVVDRFESGIRIIQQNVTSEEVNEIVSIEQIADGRFEVKSNYGHCGSHTLFQLRRVACGMDRCGLQLEFKEYQFYL